MTTRSKLLLSGGIGLVAAVILAALTFPLWRPLFVDDVVNESFPEISESEDMQDESQALPADDQQAASEEVTEEDPEMAETELEETPAPDQEVPADQQAMPEVDEPVVFASGEFIEIDAVHGAQGSATIYELPDGSRVLRFENFNATNGPDLHVILANHADPRSSAEVGEDYADLGMLKGNVGDQNYDIPPDLDLSQYQSVVIYCVPFHVVFSTATL